MPKLQNVKKVLVIGSGPIIIGQAAEFDYSGTQACRALKEEGLEVVLVNSNPATIMTDVHIADRVYVEPVNVESVFMLNLLMWNFWKALLNANARMLCWQPLAGRLV